MVKSQRRKNKDKQANTQKRSHIVAIKGKEDVTERESSQKCSLAGLGMSPVPVLTFCILLAQMMCFLKSLHSQGSLVGCFPIGD